MNTRNRYPAPHTAPIVAWMSRHEPLPEMVNDLTRRGLEVVAITPPWCPILGRERWGSARHIRGSLVMHLTGLGRYEVPRYLMLVAPVSMTAQMLDWSQRDGYHMIRPIMIGGEWAGQWKRLTGIGVDGRYCYERWMGT